MNVSRGVEGSAGLKGLSRNVIYFTMLLTQVPLLRHHLECLLYTYCKSSLLLVKTQTEKTGLARPHAPSSHSQELHDATGCTAIHQSCGRQRFGGYVKGIVLTGEFRSVSCG